MKATELRIGNYVDVPNKAQSPFRIDYFDLYKVYQNNGEYRFPENRNLKIDVHPLTWDLEECEPIPLSEEVLVRCGYTMIQENSAGKVWAFVVDGVFSSDLKIIQWKTTDKAGKFFRGELEIQGLHHLQNIQYALTGHELELK